MPPFLLWWDSFTGVLSIRGICGVPLNGTFKIANVIIIPFSGNAKNVIVG